MKHPNAAQASFLLALVAGIAVTEAARERICVKNHGITFNVDWWGSDCTTPYQVSFRTRGIFSEYYFNDAGRLALLYVGAAGYQFNTAVEAAGHLTEAQSVPAPSDRMLLSMQAEAEADGMEFDHRRRLYDCSDCEQTWHSMCDMGLLDVCSWAGNEPQFFTWATVTSIRRMCKKFSMECITSAETTCRGLCNEAPITLGSAPTINPARQDEPTAPTLPKSPQDTNPAPQDEPTDPCASNPCENGGSCSIDSAGGHVCACASDFGGMACQTDTSLLDPFHIDIEFIGTWTEARMSVFQSAADKWSEVITHVPCGGTDEMPAGRLLITSILEGIDGPGNILGSAGPTMVWMGCPTISFKGNMKFDIDDIASLEAAGTFEGVVLHEMGHVIGVGTLWGQGFGECTTCREDASPSWTCPAALSAYADIGGSGSDIIELGGAAGTSCGHLDETVFEDELMTGFIDYTMYLSKMTAAILDDLNYIVNPSAVGAYTLPSQRDPTAVSNSPPQSTPIADIAVETTIFAMDCNNNAIEAKHGIAMEF